MATAAQERVPARKKVTTYGKAARRRIPELSFASIARKSQTPDLSEVSNEVAASQAVSAAHSKTPTKVRTTTQTSPSRIPEASAHVSEDIYDVPMSDDNNPMPRSKKINAPPVRAKPKVARQKIISKPVSSSTSSTSDIWDVPDDVAETSKPLPRPAATSAKPKPRLRKSPSLGPQNTPPRKMDGSHATSADHKGSIAAARRTLKSIQKSVVSDYAAAESTDSIFEGMRKRLRLSPASELPAQSSLTTILAKSARRQTALTSQHSNLTMSSQQTTTMVARLKIMEPTLKLRTVQGPNLQLPSPQRFSLASGNPSASGSDIEMIDDSPKHISPRGMKILQKLVDSVDVSVTESHKLAIKTERGKSRTEQLSSRGNLLSRPAGVSKHAYKSLKVVPRRRLIDSLVEQTQDESEDEVSEDSDDSMSDSTPSSQLSLGSAPQGNQLPVVSNSQPMAIDIQPPQIGPRLTYTRVRSMLNEQDIMKDLQMGFSSQMMAQEARPRRVGAPGFKSQLSLQSEEEDEDTTSAIRSVHELRFAGANNRFLDEVQDFLERIGSPAKTSAGNSTRRAALLDLANKMKDKSFSKQFRSNGVEQKLFLHLGQETDILCGFLMVSLLIAVLQESNMPHIISQLRRHGITRLIIRLLESQSSVVSISKDRKSNMSKVAQSLVAEHQSHLLSLPTWDELQPEALSPRTLALKCLEVMVRQTREAGLTGEIFSKELTTLLFSVMKTASGVECWDLPKSDKSVDFYLALSALESHSIAARTLHDEAIWISDYLPIIASTLEQGLSQPTDTFGKLQVLLLRLTLNVTNNNPEASAVFTKSSLMAVMAKTIVLGFRKILQYMTEEDLATVLEHLILILGVMINFAEWSSAARESLQNLHGQDGDPLESIIKIFTENREITSMADSMEENMKNVAFGYLSVMLGYLSLLPPISKRIKQAQPRKTIAPLVSSIEEFISHHKTVDSQVAVEDDDGHDTKAGLTERLENLVSKMIQMQ